MTHVRPARPRATRLAAVCNLARAGEAQPDRLEPYEQLLADLLFAALANYDETERQAIGREFQRVAGAKLPVVDLYTQGLNFARTHRLGNTQDQLPDPVSSFEGSPPMTTAPQQLTA